PGEQLAHGGVGVGVGTAGYWSHRRELGVAQRCEDTGDTSHNVGQHQCWAGRVAGCLSRGDENSGSNDRPDAEGSQGHRPKDTPQAVVALGLLQQYVKSLLCEQLIWHGSCTFLGSTLFFHSLQAAYSVSIMSVTGPSLISSTCMSAP